MSLTRTTSTMFHGLGSATPARAFRSDIQALRGIAVLLVVLYHAKAPGFSGGFVGVDVFFVISGFLITPMLHDEVTRRETIDFVGFVARRIRRLLPAMAVMLVVTGLAGFLIYSPFRHPELANTLLSCAVYASNLYFTWRQTDYLAGNVSESPLLHTWSLSVEEQFYFVWPLMVLLAAWVARRTGRNVTDTMLAAMVLCGALSLGLSLWLTDANQPFAFFMMPTRVWEFAAGGAAALAVQHRAFLADRRAAAVIAPAALATLALTSLLLGEKIPFPGLVAVIPVAATALVLAAGTTGPAERVMSSKALQYCGTVSYSFYLWHWPVLLYAEELGLGESLAARLSWVAVSFCLAVASYHLVENPVRRSRALGLQPMRAIALLVGFSAVSGLAAVTWKGAASSWQDAPGQRVLASAEVRATSLRDDGCVAGFDAIRPVACHYGEEGSQVRIVLFGDSHAAQWFVPLRRLAEERGWSLTTFVKSACPAAKVGFHYYAVGRRYRECEQWRDRALERVARMRPDLIVVTSSLSYDVEAASWGAGTAALFGQLARSGGAVLHLRDNPRPGFDVPACLSQAKWWQGWGSRLGLPSRDCRFERPEGAHLELFAAESAAIAAGAQIHGIDLYARICPGDICPVLSGQTPIYRDSNHLTEGYVETIADEVEAKVLELVRPSGSDERRADRPASATARASL